VRIRRPVSGIALAAVSAALTIGTWGSAGAATRPPAQKRKEVQLASAGGTSEVHGCDPSKVTLRLAYEQGGVAGVQLATKEMEAKYPGLKIEGSPSSITSYDQLSQIVVANKAAGIDDNVVQAGQDQVHFWVDTYHPSPLDTAELSPTYNKTYLSIGAVDGKDYMAPFQVDFPALFVNTTLTEKAGLGPNDLPKDSSQLLADAAKVKKATGLAPVDYSPDEVPDYYAQALVQSAGGTWVNPNGTAGFGTPKALKALSVYTDLGKEGLSDPAPYGQATAAFEDGTLPYYLTSTSLTAIVAKGVGDKFKWSAEAMPVPDGGTPRFPAGGNGWLILSNNRCTVAYASQMISDMLSPSVVEASSKTYPYIPVDTAALGPVVANDKGSPQLTFVESYKGPLTPWSGFPGAVTNNADTIIEMMVEEMVGGATPKSVVPSAVSQINALVKNQQGG